MRLLARVRTDGLDHRVFKISFVVRGCESHDPIVWEALRRVKLPGYKVMVLWREEESRGIMRVHMVFAMHEALEATTN